MIFVKTHLAYYIYVPENETSLLQFRNPEKAFIDKTGHFFFSHEFCYFQQLTYKALVCDLLFEQCVYESYAQMWRVL